MKSFLTVVVCFLMVTVYGVTGKLVCEVTSPENIPREWITMVRPCIKATSDQIQAELTAAMTYLAMGAHFSKDTVNRPGFAEHFFKSASEEREHAIKLLEYLSMRGELTAGLSKLIHDPRPLNHSWISGIQALRDALKLEADVTRKIRNIIVACEAEPNDYHIVDYLTGVYLEEQYKGQRELAGYVATLDKMNEHHGPLGEFLFDKKLLNNQL